MINVSVGAAPAAMRAAVLAMKRADSAVRRDVSGRMRETMTPVWRQEVAKGAGSGMESAMLVPGSRIAAGNPGQLVAAASRRTIGNGLNPDKHWAGYEYGANRDKYWTTHSSKGTAYRRRVNRHLPPRGKGRVLEPAAKNLLPRIAAFWTQSVVRAFMDAAEGKG